MNTTDTCTAEDCASPTRGGYTLCQPCGLKLRHLLADTPELRLELTTTFTRQDKIGTPTRNAPGNHTPLAYKTGAAEALDVLDNVLWAWADTIAPNQSHRDPLSVLNNHLDHLAHHPDAGQALDELADAHQVGWTEVDLPAPDVHLGQCGAETHHQYCHEHLYARPGDTHTQCKNCGTLHDIAARRQIMLDHVQETRVTQREALSWIHTLTGHAIPAATFRSWLGRHRLAPLDTNAHGKPLYRFGDVHNLAQHRIAPPAEHVQH